ncbi:MAG: rhomboid family intramembrane serine protease [Candidatus Krumholzibacteria bacterium]|jgi:membrane associated rhomboid family serine protease|nr:rhomboid family intramembrane serine protease [Candidatus Krumholzibacteria bacterium]
MYFAYFYPIGLDLPRRRQPWLSMLLIGSILAVFVWQRWFADRLPVHPWDLVFFVGGGRPWTAASALLLHAGWLHLAGNLVYLGVFLPALEDRLGRAGILLLFLVTGIAGNLAHGIAAWQGWLGQTGLGILGASGAISGLLGFALVRIPYARVAVAYWVLAPLQGQNRAGRCRLPLPAAVMAWLLLQVVQASLADESASLVSYPAHLGGFGLGLVLAMCLGGARDARAESRLLRARRYLAGGDGLAAAGAYADYLALQPGDLAAAAEQARALVMGGVAERAAAAYRDVFRRATAAGRWDLALATLAEGRRGGGGLGLDVDELAAAARESERAGDQDLALCLYMDLVQQGRAHPASDRAWVRLLLLLHADPARQAEARVWLARARQSLPAGAWRDYLEQTFRQPPDDRAQSAPDTRPQPAAPRA